MSKYTITTCSQSGNSGVDLDCCPWYPGTLCMDMIAGLTAFSSKHQILPHFFHLFFSNFTLRIFYLQLTLEIEVSLQSGSLAPSNSKGAIYINFNPNEKSLTSTMEMCSLLKKYIFIMLLLRRSDCL